MCCSTVGAAILLLHKRREEMKGKMIKPNILIVRIIGELMDESLCLFHLLYCHKSN